MATTSAISSASEIQMNFMKILVAQLKNQNPLEPMDNNDMTAQLAQLSQLQQLETMNSNLQATNSSFASALAYASQNYANSLIGRNVSFLANTGTEAPQEMSGTVEEVLNDTEGKIVLGINTPSGKYTLPLDGVITVKEG